MRDDDDAALPELTIPEVRDDPESDAPTLGGPAAPRNRAPQSSLSRYRLGSAIGRGGMGEVVSANDDQIGRSVAVKRMRGSTSDEARARFIREARIQGRLEHPAVVPVHELATDDVGEPYFVMKQLAGTTLHDVIAQLAAGDAMAAKTFTRQRLLRAFADTCLAVEFAHTRGVIHRDLKPANLMLGDFGEVYILDWGIARVTGDTAAESFSDIDSVAYAHTQAGAVLGTPGYMSPEQARVDDLDGRADVYSLGCILFEILALQSMHPRGMPGVTAALAGDQTIPSARAPDRNIPPELDAICQRATMFEPADRHATARELGDAVQAYLDGDRDVALRRQLAAAELVKAREALARGNDTNHRRDAMRAAGRALALEPTDQAAAELVARLMLEPPVEIPAEVHGEIEKRELDALSATRRLISRSAVTTLTFIPLLIWAGIRDPIVLTVIGATTLIIAATAAWFPKAWPVSVGRIALAGWLLIVVMMSYLTSPFLLASGLVVIIGMATHRAIIHPALLFAALTLASFVPWALDPDMVSVVGNDLVIHAATGQLNAFATQIGLTINAVSIGLTAVVVSRALIDDRRAIQLRVEIQAWQLRQLVPEPTT